MRHRQPIWLLITGGVAAASIISGILLDAIHVGAGHFFEGAGLVLAAVAAVTAAIRRWNDSGKES
jgi:hypothetical protein